MQPPPISITSVLDRNVDGEHDFPELQRAHQSNESDDPRHIDIRSARRAVTDQSDVVFRHPLTVLVRDRPDDNVHDLPRSLCPFCFHL